MNPSDYYLNVYFSTDITIVQGKVSFFPISPSDGIYFSEDVNPYVEAVDYFSDELVELSLEDLIQDNIWDYVLPSDGWLLREDLIIPF